MPIRRAVLAAATLVVAVVVALAVPVSQLRTFSFVSTCCCPDPSDCHCPPAPCDDGKHDAMKRCHNTMADVVTGATPTVTPVALRVAVAPIQVIAIASYVVPAPHAAPDPRRPSAPS